MWFWRSRGSKIFAWWFASLLFLPTTALTQEEADDHKEATRGIAVTLSGITSYNDYLEIRTALAKSEGVERVVLNSEAPGLIAMTVRYAGETRGLIESLSTLLHQKYKFTEKSRKTGSELNITRAF